MILRKSFMSLLGGDQPANASSNPAKSNPGATTQLTSAQPRSAAAMAGRHHQLRHCPPHTSPPSCCHCGAASRRSDTSRGGAAPACQHQISSASTRCQCDPRLRAENPSKFSAGVTARYISRYQPPSRVRRQPQRRDDRGGIGHQPAIAAVAAHRPPCPCHRPGLGKIGPGTGPPLPADR